MGIILGYYRDAYWSTSISECHKECVSWELGTSRSFTSWFCNWKNWHCDFKWKKLGRGCTLMNSDHVDGYMFVFFFKSGVSFFVFTCCFNRVARGGISKSPHVGGENSPFNFSGRLWAPAVDLRFCIHHCRFQQHEAMAKRGVWLWLDSTHIFYWSIRESPPQKKTWRRSSPVLQKKRRIVFLSWFSLVIACG